MKWIREETEDIVIEEAEAEDQAVEDQDEDLTEVACREAVAEEPIVEEEEEASKEANHVITPIWLKEGHSLSITVIT